MLRIGVLGINPDGLPQHLFRLHRAALRCVENSQSVVGRDPSRIDGSSFEIHRLRLFELSQIHQETCEAIKTIRAGSDLQASTVGQFGVLEAARYQVHIPKTYPNTVVAGIQLDSGADGGFGFSRQSELKESARQLPV